MHMLCGNSLTDIRSSTYHPRARKFASDRELPARNPDRSLSPLRFLMEGDPCLTIRYLDTIPFPSIGPHASRHYSSSPPISRFSLPLLSPENSRNQNHPWISAHQVRSPSSKRLGPSSRAHQMPSIPHCQSPRQFHSPWSIRPMEHLVRFHQSPESQNTAIPPKHQALSKP